MLLAGAEDDVDALRLGALGGGQQLAVEAELEDEVGLGAARELGVGDLVAVGAEGGGPVDAEEEVGVAAEGAGGAGRALSRRAGRGAGPGGPEEGRLVDHVGPGAQRLLGLRRSRFQRGARAVRGKRDLLDLPPLRLQRLQISPLVLVPLTCQQLRIRPPIGRLPNLPPSPSQIQRNQVPTSKKVVQIAGGNDQLPIKYLHTPPQSKSTEHMPPRTATFCLKAGADFLHRASERELRRATAIGGVSTLLLGAGVFISDLISG